MESGFCADRLAKIDQMVPGTNDTRVRSLVMAMAEPLPVWSLCLQHCRRPTDIEPDLPRQIAVTVEITSAGPIAGPLWVTGNIPIVRADGQPFETRNRVTLCSCRPLGNQAAVRRRASDRRQPCVPVRA